MYTHCIQIGGEVQVYVSILVKSQYMLACKLRVSICKHASYKVVYVSMLVKRQYM